MNHCYDDDDNASPYIDTKRFEWPLDDNSVFEIIKRKFTLIAYEIFMNIMKCILLFVN